MPVAPLEIYEQLLSHMLQTSRRNFILYLKNTQTQSTLIWRSNVSLKIKDNQVSENLTNINTHTLFLLPIFFPPPNQLFSQKKTPNLRNVDPPPTNIDRWVDPLVIWGWSDMDPTSTKQSISLSGRSNSWTKIGGEIAIAGLLWWLFGIVRQRWVALLWW